MCLSLVVYVGVHVGMSFPATWNRRHLTYAASLRHPSNQTTQPALSYTQFWIHPDEPDISFKPGVAKIKDTVQLGPYNGPV